MRDHSYQEVRSEEDAGVDEDIPLQGRISSSDESTPPFAAYHVGSKSRIKPSVYRLLPYFFLSSLAFGLTMVPRVNVLVTLICQQIVDGSQPAGGMNSRRREMPAGAMSVSETSGSGMSQNVTGAALSMGPSDATCSTPPVLAGVAFMSTYRDLTTGIIGTIMSYYLGKLSDRVGRVKVMVLNGIGILASELVMLLVVAFPGALNYRWLFLSFVVDGLSGSFPLLMATASSYVTDISSDKDRVIAMGWIQSGMFCGMAVGPALGSALSRLSGPDRPSAIFIYAILCRILGLMCLSTLPESLQDIGRDMKAPEPRSRSSPWAEFSFKSIFSLNLLDVLFGTQSNPVEIQRNRRYLMLLMSVNAIIFGTSIGVMDVMMLYPQAQFKWGMVETGNFISIINIFRTLSTTAILRLLIRLFTKATAPGSSTRDQEIKCAHLPLLRLALCADVLGYIGFGVVPTGFLFVVAGVVSSISAMGISASQASMSMMVSVEHVGNLMGILGSLQALTRLVSPPAINLIYAWTVSFLPQGVFFGLAVVVGLGVVMTYLMEHFES